MVSRFILIWCSLLTPDYEGEKNMKTLIADLAVWIVTISRSSFSMFSSTRLGFSPIALLMSDCFNNV